MSDVVAGAGGLDLDELRAAAEAWTDPPMTLGPATVLALVERTRTAEAEVERLREDNARAWGNVSAAHEVRENFRATNDRLRAERDAAHRAQADVLLIRTAINDPGQFTKRADDYTESIGSWGARAVVIALAASRSSSPATGADGCDHHYGMRPEIDCGRSDMHPTAEAVTEPETLRWGGGSGNVALDVITWINANGGSARHQPSRGYQQPACILIHQADNTDLVMLPGDEAVKGGWFTTNPSAPLVQRDRLREFTVRRPAPEEAS
jgi:hypothetical protein